MEKLSKNNCVLVIIDVQEKFRPAINKFDDTVENIKKLVQGFQILDVPTIVTEQYPKGLGETVDEIKDGLDFNPIEKVSFSCLDVEEFRNKIEELDKTHIILCGIETHVCVFQTAIDLHDKDYTVHLVVDAVSSRKKSDKKSAVKRMIQEGIKETTTEMILFQLLKKAGTKDFKNMSEIVK